MITLLGHIPWLAGFLVLVPAVAKELNNWRQTCFDNATARKEKGTKEKDLFYHLVLNVHLSFRRRSLGLTVSPSQSDEVGSEKERTPFDIVASDVDLAAFVGSGTLKTALSSLLYYLLCNQEKLVKLREEINRFYPPGESLSSNYFHKMGYLDACINEALRLSPPVPSVTQRDVGLDPNLSKGRTFGS